MLVKKLITLAGALGILACGACFLPLQERQPSPPPLRQEMHGIKLIGVIATNQTESHHLRSDLVADAAAARINEKMRFTGIRANAGPVTVPPDAILKIDILSEKATPHARKNVGSNMNWVFETTISAALTNHDGQVVWQETNKLHDVWLVGPEDEAEAWRHLSQRQSSVVYLLGNSFPDEIFYGK
jgi:hypothetical protein